MTDDEKRVKFHENRAVIEAKQAAVDALRVEYDTKLQTAMKALEPLMLKIRKLESPLYELKQAQGDLARELRGPDGIVRTALPEHNVNGDK